MRRSEERATSWDERKLRWAVGPGQRVDPRLREFRVAKDELASLPRVPL